MKLGLGLYKSLLNSRNFDFAKQAGATHLVVQFVDYIKGGSNPTLADNYLDGWGPPAKRSSNGEKVTGAGSAVTETLARGCPRALAMYQLQLYRIAECIRNRGADSV